MAHYSGASSAQLSLQASATISLGQSQSGRVSGNVAQLSAILKESGASPTKKGLAQLADKSNWGRFQNGELQEVSEGWLMTKYAKRLIVPAAAASKAVYDLRGNFPDLSEWKPEPLPNARAGSKPSRLWTRIQEGTRMILYSVRGTDSLHDWLVNFDSRPTEKLAYHPALWDIAKAMLPTLLECVEAILSQAKNEDVHKTILLLTGHSAGGGVVSLLAQMLPTRIEGISVIECITFGTAASGIVNVASESSTEQTGHEMSTPRRTTNFILELDPVPRVDFDYAVWACQAWSQFSVWDEKCGNPLILPPLPKQVVSVPGDLVLLKQVGPFMNPDAKLFHFTFEQLGKRCFLDANCHEINTYLRLTRLFYNNAHFE